MHVGMNYCLAAAAVHTSEKYFKNTETNALQKGTGD